VPGLVGRDLGAIRHVVCASPTYFKKSGRPKAPQDLRDHNCLVNPFSRPKNWPFANSSRPLLVEVKGSLSSTSNDVLIQMALHHCGIIRVPLDTVKVEIADKRLEMIFRKSSLSPERMCAYVAKTGRLPAKTAEFVGFLKAAIGPG